MNAYDQMNQAINEAKAHINAADNSANSIAALLVGRLKRVDDSTLRKLKRELRDYNPHTRTWK